MALVVPLVLALLLFVVELDLVVVVVVAVVLVRILVFFLVLLNSSKKRLWPDASEDEDEDDDLEGANGLAGVRLTFTEGLTLSSEEDSAFFVDTASVEVDAEGLAVKYLRIESCGGAAPFLLLVEPDALVSEDMMRWDCLAAKEV